jgi:hypothetical protein
VGQRDAQLGRAAFFRIEGAGVMLGSMTARKPPNGKALGKVDWVVSIQSQN